MTFTPSPYQQAVYDWVRTGSGNAFVNAVAGAGKCLGIDTPVMMYDGRIVPVQNLSTGMKLMGPDSRPRTILSTTVGRGGLVKIVPVKGEPWVCNYDHVLSLAGTNRMKGVTTDMSVTDYLRKCERERSFRSGWKLFSVGVDFPPQNDVDLLTVDPYFLGVWFGDGTKAVRGTACGNTHLVGVAVSKPDKEILDVCLSVAKSWGLTVSSSYGGTCPTHRLSGAANVGGSNRLLDEMRMLVGSDVTIPRCYLVSSRANRLEFLAGLLDSDGHSSKGGFEITQKRGDYADDISFLARSLGFRVARSVKVVNQEPYHRMYISGDLSLVPTRIPRKKAAKRAQIKDHMVTGFSIEEYGHGEYYGFTLDGDGRFLLGDFTVTHNTSTLVAACHFMMGDVMFMAFGKDIATDIQTRVAGLSNVKASTFHAVGWRAWKRLYPKCVIDADGKTSHTTKNVPRDYFKPVMELVSMAKQSGVGVVWDKTDMSCWLTIVDHFGVEAEDIDKAIKLAVEVLDWGYRIGTEVVDFDDMLWLPLVDKIVLDKYDWVLVDECQDTSDVRRLFVKAMMHEDSRAILVGDPGQSIMAFTGADSDACDKIVDDFNCIELPLSLTYRCSKAATALAQKFVPHIVAADGNKDGVVKTVDSDDFRSMVVNGKLVAGDAVLCRKVRPLVTTALALIRAGVPCHVEGKDIGAAVVGVVNKLKADDVSDLRGKLSAYYHNEVAKVYDRYKPRKDFRMNDGPAFDNDGHGGTIDHATFTAIADLDAQFDRDVRLTHDRTPVSITLPPSGERAIERLNEQLETIYAVIDGCVTIAEVRARVAYLFASTKPGEPARGVTLSTVHKAKGREWSRVFVLGYFGYMPSPRATKDWEVQQEMNLMYVAVTRTKDELYLTIVDTEDDKW